MNTSQPISPNACLILFFALSAAVWLKSGDVLCVSIEMRTRSRSVVLPSPSKVDRTEIRVTNFSSIKEARRIWALTWSSCAALTCGKWIRSPNSDCWRYHKSLAVEPGWKPAQGRGLRLSTSSWWRRTRTALRGWLCTETAGERAPTADLEGRSSDRSIIRFAPVCRPYEVARGQRPYVLDWLFNARGSGHAPDSFAAPSGTSANSYDRRRYAFGHVICADADALQARPPSNGR